MEKIQQYRNEKAKELIDIKNKSDRSEHLNQIRTEDLYIHPQLIKSKRKSLENPEIEPLEKKMIEKEIMMFETSLSFFNQNS